ncbi:aldehyde dehydrogenase isoform 1, partial [Danaus plexippus plexippus]
TLSSNKPKAVNMSEVVNKARDTFDSGVTKPIEWRRKQLKNLLRMYEENRNAMVEALVKDLRRSKMEAILLEVDYLINDIRNTIYNLDNWVAPVKPPKGLVNMLDDVVIYNDPYGVVLIIGAWNYPLQLLLLPLAGAIAAGNAVILKPSELAEASAKFMVETLPKYVDSDAIILVEGGPEETSELLKQRFDYIFYTGGTNVGRIVYAAATKNLTPVTLELGGKSPVYIDNTVDIEVTAKRILWGKFINAGQTCIAPDYILCSRTVQDKFVDAAKNVLREFYGEDPQKSPDLCRIINNRHFSRLQALIDASKDKVAIGGRYDSQDKYIAPTLLANVTASDVIMKDEIFGPILPIVPVENAYEAIKFINEREHPLVLYVFSVQSNIQQLFTQQTRSGSLCINDTIMFYGVQVMVFVNSYVYNVMLYVNDNVVVDVCREKPLVLYAFTTDEELAKRIAENTSSGGMCINDTVMQMGVDTLPFGGVGSSGMGAYHGKASFDTFTHKKSCLIRNFAAIGERLGSGRYPPYTDGKLSFITTLMRKRNGPSLKYLPHLIAFALGAGVAYGIATWQKMSSEHL